MHQAAYISAHYDICAGGLNVVQLALQNCAGDVAHFYGKQTAKTAALFRAGQFLALDAFELGALTELSGHLAEADLWYTDRLTRWPEAPLFRLAAARGIALERLRDMSEERRASVTSFDGEDWTPRKVMRRMLEHEREHIHEIRELLAAQQK